MDQPYIYGGLEAWSYDLVDELSQFEDFGFFRMMLESCPGPVLDVGCGTGRILLGLKEQGLDVAGLDSSPEMLRQCRQKLSANQLEAELYEGDMRSFDLKRSFSTILIPGFSIQLLTEDNDLQSCLERCYQHLSPGGQLIVSTYFPWEFHESGKDGEGLAFRCESESAETEERLEPFRVGRSISAMKAFLENAGFEDLLLYGDFEFAEPAPEAETIVFVAIRPETLLIR